MPPFLVGRIRWDNWLLTQFIGNKESVAIDASETVFAVHLNHMNVRFLFFTFYFLLIIIIIFLFIFLFI